MQRTLRTNSRITPEIHAEAAAEIHAYFCGNLSTFRQELLDDATNAKFLKSVEDAETLFELGDDPDEEELKDLGQFRDFSSKWVRTALIPTVIDHLNEVFCRKGFEGSGGEDEATGSISGRSRTRFSGQSALKRARHRQTVSRGTRTRSATCCLKFSRNRTEPSVLTQ